MRTCGICKQGKPLEEFGKLKIGKDGINTRCKKCVNSYFSSYRAENEDNERIKRKRYLSKPEARKMRDDRMREYGKIYRLEKAGELNHRNRLRQAAQQRAIPSWANLDKIEEIYVQSKTLSTLTGQQYHVDHIVPLRGKTVCGLHVENNLRIVLAEDNLTKSSKLLEDIL